MRIFSPAEMARSRRPSAAAMSRIASGSCRSSKAGHRNRRAASGSPSPRAASTFAAGAPMPRARASAVADSACTSGRTQRRTMGSVLGEIPAEGLVVAQLVVRGAGHDLLVELDELLVPVGLDFVHIQPLVVVERKLERAGLALV